MNKNSIKTAVLLACSVPCSWASDRCSEPGGLVIGLLLGLVFVGGSYWFSDTLSVRRRGRVPVTEQEAPQLYAIVRDLTTRAGMPMPKIYISPAQQPNAFATGRSPEHAAVAVTQGLLQVVNRGRAARRARARDLARSPPRHPDLFGRRCLAMGIMFLARMRDVQCALRWRWRPRQRRREHYRRLADDHPRPVAAGFLQAALSRSREFDADLGGAELLGTGEPLASALQKIDAYAKQVPMNIDPAHASLFIVNPLTGRKMQFENLFTTHPPTEERIARLRTTRVAPQNCAYRHRPARHRQPAS